ncbi:hypothetical protein C8F04DRAFT_1336881 [Mycena alexandri]|uniref:Uncharacterized protein n=1 Tax=Mycena alexandri TaxID=1745969 RepID=A0AAD6RZU6_9AGAR|nr:hypothetical protein C8F04DRAFT_1336881 [Mycena alexandri]
MDEGTAASRHRTVVRAHLLCVSRSAPDGHAWRPPVPFAAAVACGARAGTASLQHPPPDISVPGASRSRDLHKRADDAHARWPSVAFATACLYCIIPAPAARTDIVVPGGSRSRDHKRRWPPRLASVPFAAAAARVPVPHRSIETSSSEQTTQTHGGHPSPSRLRACTAFQHPPPDISVPGASRSRDLPKRADDAHARWPPVAFASAGVVDDHPDPPTCTTGTSQDPAAARQTTDDGRRTRTVPAPAPDTTISGARPDGSHSAPLHAHHARTLAPTPTTPTHAPTPTTPTHAPTPTTPTHAPPHTPTYPHPHLQPASASASPPRPDPDPPRPPPRQERTARRKGAENAIVSLQAG